MFNNLKGLANGPSVAQSSRGRKASLKCSMIGEIADVDQDSVDSTERPPPLPSKRPVDDFQRQQSGVRGYAATKEASPQRRPVPAPPPNARRSSPPHRIPQHMRKGEYIEVLQAQQDSHLKVIASLQKQVHDLEEDIITLERHYVDQQTKQKQAYEAEIQQLQKQAFQDIKESRFQPDDDTTVTNRLVRIQGLITAFAKTYALDSLTGLKSQPERSLVELGNALNDRGIASISSNEAVLEVVEMRHSARLLLTGLLSSAVHSMAFDNPFFFMSDGLQHRFDALPGSFRDLLNRMDPAETFSSNFELIEGVDRRQAHIWRSDTLRALNPDKHDTSEAAEKLRDLLQHGLRERCSQAATAFEAGAARFMIQPLEAPLKDSFRNSLVALFEEAGGLAMRLWTQRTGIACRYKPDLANVQFAVDSPIMQAHALHKLDDPDDRRLDGRPVKLTLHPAILRLGTHDGDSYDQSCVWAKAVVWLEV
ncbi:hypothetical protein LTR53_000896 [Teratosphaeriaceae sp. CCFEE 6253]|nr:hypothetical protein LTR53_000896 [Teratosphaeriaceae sp. CCFEE 6253]